MTTRGPARPLRPLKIALVEHPRQKSWVHQNDIANTPLSSSLMTGYVAGSLEADGHEVTIVEGHLAHLSHREVLDAVRSAEPALVGVHCVYDWSDGAHLRRLFADVQETVGPLPVFLYGFYPTFAYRDLLATAPGALGVAIGEPELTLREVAGAASSLRAGAEWPRALDSIPGLALRTAGGVRLTGPRGPIEDLDRLPAPRRTAEMMALREVNLAGSRGCYGSCTFCSVNPFYGNGSSWRPRSPESVAAEMEAVLEEHPGKGRFYFVDPNFFGPGARGRNRAVALGRIIHERYSVRFGLEGRVNDIDEAVVAALAEAGLDEILIGLESGSDASLARLAKRTTVDQNRRALRILRAHGIEPNVGFIMFEPESDLDALRVNLAFLEEEDLLSRLSVTANVLHHSQILLAPTPAYQKALAEGRLRVSPVNPYEGSIPYRHPEVAFLAETMAEVCRQLFSGLPLRVWLDGQERTDPTLVDLNGRLVALFRRLIDELSSKRLSPSAEAARDVLDEVGGWLTPAAAL